MPLELQQRFDEAVALCEEGSDPQGLVRCFELDRRSQDAGMAVKGTSLVLPGKDIEHRLHGCSHACLMAVTLGMRNERALMRQQAVSGLDALMLDACSSSLVEEAANAASAIIDRLAHLAGARVTKRYSPGYGDLPLDVQPVLLDALQAGRLLGIHTADSHFMTPMKSITAIIGVKWNIVSSGDTGRG